MIRIVMFILHLYYKKYGKPIFYIKGKGKAYPKYLLYTEEETIRIRMELF